MRGRAFTHSITCHDQELLVHNINNTVSSIINYQVSSIIALNKKKGRKPALNAKCPLQWGVPTQNSCIQVCVISTCSIKGHGQMLAHVVIHITACHPAQKGTYFLKSMRIECRHSNSKMLEHMSVQISVLSISLPTCYMHAHAYTQTWWAHGRNITTYIVTYISTVIFLYKRLVWGLLRPSSLVLSIFTHFMHLSKFTISCCTCMHVLQYDCNDSA